METKIIFLLFISGAIVVLAEKEGIEEKGINGEKGSNDENKKEIEVKIQSHDTFETKELFGKLQEVPIPLTREALKFFPKLDGRSSMLWLLTKTLLEKFYSKGVLILYSLEKQITDKKEKYEDSLKSNLEIAQQTLKEQEGSGTKKTNKKGKEEAETKKCLEGSYSSADIEITKSVESGYNCFDNALEDARIILEDARNDFNKTFTKSYEEIKEKTKIPLTCRDTKTRCLRIRLGATFQKIEELINASNALVKKTKEDLDRPNRDMDDCYQETLQKLNEGKNTLFKFMRNCEDKAKLEGDEEEETEYDQREEEKTDDHQKGEEEEKTDDHQKGEEEEKTDDHQKGEEEEKTEDEHREEESKVELYKEEKAKVIEKR